VGSKLAQLAQVIALAAGSVALAGPSADELVKQGTEAYGAGHYDDAITALKQAYELDHRKETLFALAQAERLGGHCPAAVAHYKQLLAKMTDLESSKLIEGNVALCENTEAVTRPTEPAPAPATKTVVRVERRGDPLATTLFATGTLAIGAAAGLYIAANNAQDDAKTAGTLAVHNQLDDRANQEHALSYVALGVGVGAMGYAVYRWLSGGDEPKAAAVSVAPTAHGAAVGLALRF
jgi:hypothetical protein